MMVDLGTLSDKDKCLLKLMQGTATTGTEICKHYMIICLYIGPIHEVVVEILKAIESICIIDDDETQPHICNQGIAFSSGSLQLLCEKCFMIIIIYLGTFSAILTYVLQFCITDQEVQEDLLTLSCNALRTIARGNTHVIISNVYMSNIYYCQMLGSM